MLLGFRKLANLLVLLTCIIMFACALWGGLVQDPILNEFIETFIICYMVIAFLRQLGLFLGTIAFKAKIKAQFSKNKNYEPFVSIIVPAYNEENVIGQALESLLNLDYKNYEVIIVDDGSKDSTTSRVWNVIARYPQKKCRLVIKENGGKASALNRGLSLAEGQLIMCVDSDSRLNKMALRNGVRHFVDPKVAAVSGFIRVASTHNLLLKFQDLEYSITLNFNRPALALSGSVTIVPGPAGLFRKESLLSVGGYKSDRSIFAEDADLTVRLLAKGYKVTSESQMISFTEAPETLFALLRQRYRWNRGIIQALLHNLKPLLNTQGWRIKCIAAYLMLDAYGVRIVNFALVLYFLGNFYGSGQVHLFTAWFAVLIAVDATIITFTALDLKQYMRNLAVMVFSRLTYAFVILTWGVFSLIDECLSSKMSWDKLERTGQISGGLR